METLAQASDLRGTVHFSAHSFPPHEYPEVLLHVGPWVLGTSWRRRDPHWWALTWGLSEVLPCSPRSSACYRRREVSVRGLWSLSGASSHGGSQQPDFLQPFLPSSSEGGLR